MIDILLAEDNPADVYLIREALKHHAVDASVRVAADGKDVLEQIRKEGAQAPALIILDLNLPRHDGIEVLEVVRATPELSDTPVVVLTSSDSPRDRLNALHLGATRYIRKPSNLNDFLNLGAIFKELLEKSGGASEATSNGK